MSQFAPRIDECAILVKALPHRSSKLFETVCCAGVGRDGSWRRQYPVPFRILDPSQKFKRWTWIKYEFVKPRNDHRHESQKVDYKTLEKSDQLRTGERPRLIQRLLRSTLAEASARGESLSLIRPQSLKLSAQRKTDKEIYIETARHAEFAKQYDLFDKQASPLKPCPMKFFICWHDNDGEEHRHQCDDWETSTAFFRRSHKLGDEEAIDSLRQTYEIDYLNKGVALEHFRLGLTRLGIPFSGEA